MQVGDRYLQSLSSRPRGRRAGVLVLAAALHAAVIAGVLGWGLYHLQEMPAPSKALIFYGAKLPPTAQGGGIRITKFKKQSEPKLARHELVQPPETPSRVEADPAREPASSGECDGTGPGTGPGNGAGEGDGPGGCSGDGCPSGSPSAAVAPPRLVDPQVGAAQRIAGETPRYGDRARSAGVQGTVVARICVSPEGAVSSVSLLRGLPLLDESVLNAVRLWRYKPFTVGGKAMPFCYVANFSFVLQGR
jgi:periplasmic protein TonB